MLLSKKHTFFASLILALFNATLARTAASIVPEQLSTSAIAAKAFARAGTGLGIIAASSALALGAHIATEYPIVYTHEAGHAIAAGISPRRWQSAISITCILKKHPLASFVPFFGATDPFGGSYYLGDKTLHAAGPIAGIAAAYASVLLAHGLTSLAQGNTFREGLRNNYKAPLAVYKLLANGISDAITKKSAYTLPTFLGLSAQLFTLLKSSKIFGEILYGLTPFGTSNGDGDHLWRNLGLQQNYNVTPIALFGLSVTPVFAAAGYGLCKGIYASLCK